MSRRRLKVAVAVLLVIAALVGGALWALPEIVRSVALRKIPELTGRAASIEDVDLNVFTGRFAVKKLRIARRPGHGSEAFAEFDRLEGRVAPLALVRSDVHIVSLKLVRPAVRITRTAPFSFDFSDLLELFVKPVGKEEPSRWTVSVGRLAITGGTVVVDDAVLSPPQTWRIDDLDLEVASLTTQPNQPPGRLRLGGRLGDSQIEATSEAIHLTPVNVSLAVSVKAFDLGRIRPYVPPDVPVVPERGVVDIALKLDRVRTGDALAQSTVSGDIRLQRLAVARRDGTPSFMEVERLAVAIKQMDFLGRDVTIDHVDVEGLELRAVRESNGEIDLVALLARPAPARPADTAAAPASESRGAGSQPAETPAPTAPALAAASAVRLDRLSVRSSAVALTDRFVSPARDWKIDGLTLDGARLSTRREDAPGTLSLRAQLSGAPGQPATIAVDADPVRLTPSEVSARVNVQGVRVAVARPYIPDTLPAVASDGVVEVALDVAAAVADGALQRARASGDVRIRDLALVQRGGSKPFLSIPKLSVGIKSVDPLAREIAIGAIQVEGARIEAVRDASGRIDLVGLLPAAEPALEEVKARTGVFAETPPAPRAPPGPQVPEWRVSLDRFVFDKGTLSFDDRLMKPAATFELSGLKLSAEKIAWPFTRPGTFTFLTLMPGGGWTYGKGTATLEPLNVQVYLSTRDTPIDRYQTYFPFPAQLAGTLNGDSLSEVQRGPKGELILASRGTGWANLVTVRAPGEDTPVVAMNAMVIRGIDFSWPNYALVEKITIARPDVRVERDAQGQINLRKLFEVPKGDDQPAPAPSSPEPPAPRAGETARPDGEGDLMQQIVLDFSEIEIRDGVTHFVDRTMSPPFSEDISRLNLTINNLSNILGRPDRTTLTAQALIGVDGALDMRGSLSGLGETLRADLVAEVRNFSLAGTTPYAENLTSWAIQGGKLEAKIHYQVEGDRITADHAIELKGLKVDKAKGADDAQRRIGIPLGLAVALLKDSQGNIDLSLPITGTLSDQRFNWADAMWGAVKQVIGKVVLSPFRAIGRLFTGGDDSVDKLEVNPVTFSPGSAVIAPSLEAQITQLAEFLRRSPAVKLSLTTVVSPADADSIKTREVRRRLEALRRERSLPDLAAALRAHYQEQVPGVALPATVDEQVAALVAREPAPEAALADLMRRRLEAVRDDLVKSRGIDGERVMLPPAPAPALASSGEGRVEFTIVAGG